MQSMYKSSTANLNNGECLNNSVVHQHNHSAGRLHHVSHQQHEQRPHFNRHLAMNLENDMYYTVDFSDSQHSPLIQ